MRRWNGWGDPSVDARLPSEALAFLAGRIGHGEEIPDAAYDSAIASVPPSRLPPHALVTTESGDRLRHARGQSLPDWVALRHGRIGAFPDGVAYPETDEHIRILFDFADRHPLDLIPYGGGTSVVGHINPIAGDRPTLTIDLSRMARLLDLDETSRLATIEAGATGPQVEAALAERGYTLGHFPQSFEASTLGGWIATRSTGQQSLGYGRIEELFAGGHLETPSGPLDLPPFPASAAGPDLRHLVLGSEGRLGILTRAIVRIRPRPSNEVFSARFFRRWEEGVAALRRMIQHGTSATMLRLSDPTETEASLWLAGRPSAAGWVKRGLRWSGYGPAPCLLVTAASDGSGLARIGPGGRIGESWRRSRFRTPYLRNALWEAGYAIDTFETSVGWSRFEACKEAVVSALAHALEPGGERALAFAHLSHAYPDGASLYATAFFRRSVDPDETLDRWRRLKQAATQAILENGGTISHQHGVGLDHATYLGREKGLLGLAALEAAFRTFDPDGRMNPGKLILPLSPSGREPG